MPSRGLAGKSSELRSLTMGNFRPGSLGSAVVREQNYQRGGKTWYEYTSVIEHMFELSSIWGVYKWVSLRQAWREQARVAPYSYKHKGAACCAPTKRLTLFAMPN